MVEQVRALARDGGVQREGTVKVGDVGNVTRPWKEGYATVFWPTRYVTTVEHQKDVETVRP